MTEQNKPRNYHDVIIAMGDAPVEANGLYWFGLPSQKLHTLQGSSGGIVTAARGYLIKTLPFFQGCDLGGAPFTDTRFEVHRLGRAGWAVINFFPDDPYETALTLIGRAMAELLAA